jgi:hypothetical protein
MSRRLLETNRPARGNQRRAQIERVVYEPEGHDPELQWKVVANSGPAAHL